MLIEDYLKNKWLEYREAATQFNIKKCVFGCEHNWTEHKWNHFYISKDNGQRFCHKCKSKWGFNFFRAKFWDNELWDFKIDIPKDFKKNEIVSIKYDTDTECAKKLWGLNTEIQKYLTEERGFTKDTLLHFKIGVDDTSIMIPIYNKEDKLINFRKRKFPSDTSNRPKYYTITDAEKGLFNVSVLNKKPKEIFITEGEFDAMTLYQNWFTNVISTGWANNTRLIKRKLFIDVEKVFICFDNDSAWKDWVKDVIDIVWIEKCRVVTIPNEWQKKLDINDFFNLKKEKGKDEFKSFVVKAESKKEEVIKHISDFNEELRDQLLQGDYLGESTGFDGIDNVIWGFRKGRLIILSWLTSIWKCVAAESEIVNPLTWAICTMEEFVKEKRKYILSWEYDRIKKSKVLDWIDSGKKPLYKVTTDWGTSCKVTDVHPFLTQDMQWKKLKDLKIGDEIGIPKYLNIYDCSWRKQPIEIIKLIWYLLTEGYVSKEYSVTFTNFDKDLVEDFSNCLDNIWCKLSLIKKWNFRVVNKDKSVNKVYIKKAITRISKLGLEYKVKEHKIKVSDKPIIKQVLEKYKCKYGTARYKEIPKFIFTLKKNLQAEFLSVLMSCDGSVFLEKTGIIKLSYSSASYILIKQVRHLLLRFGVDTRLIEKKTNFNTVCYELVAGNIEDVRNYKNNIGFICKRKQDILSGIDKKVWRKNKYSKSALRFTKISSIDYLGEKQVYDLSVEGTKNFIVDDMLVHNTTLSLNFALSYANRQLPVFYVSMEMRPIDLCKRFLMMYKKIMWNALDEITDTDPLLKIVDEGLAEFKWKVGEDWLPIYLYNGSWEINLDSVVNACKLSIKKYWVKLIIMDHLQYFARGSWNRAAEIANITRQIKTLALELDVPIILLAHLNRQGKILQRKWLYIPMLTDLRDSWAIEQDADQVIFIARDSENKDEDEKKKTIIKIAKNRDWKTGYSNFNFNANFWLFEEVVGVDYLANKLKDSSKEVGQIEMGKIDF